MDRQHLIVDSGGTKTLAILYGDDFRPLRTVRVGSMRDNSNPPEAVRENVTKLMTELFGGETPRLGSVSGIVYPVLRKALEGKAECFFPVGELDAALAASRIFGDGLLAISGTGATMFGLWDGKKYAAGGYGSAVDDGGSGYWMGRKLFHAAIADYEGYGEKTALTGMLCDHFGRDDLRDAVFSIYAGSGVSPSTVIPAVAACAPLLDEAGKQGDAVALAILRESGQALGMQMAAFLRKFGFPRSIPITISGSRWKGHPLIFSEFSRLVREADPERAIIVPEFEPILGMLIHRMHELHGSFTEADAAFLRENYAEHLFRLSADVQ